MRLSVTKLYTEPKCSPAQPKSSDMSKDWYVWFRFFDGKNWKQLRYKKGINEFKVYKQRLAEMNALKQALKDELLAGWNPLVPHQVRTIQIYSLEEGFSHILNVKGKTVRTKTWYAYKYITGLFMGWLRLQQLDQTGIQQFTGAQAQEYMDYLLLKKQFSGRTFNDHLIVLRTFFNCFVEREWITKNPFRTVETKTTTIGRNLAYTEAEKELLIKTLLEKDIRMYFFTQIMFHCFIRRTEMTAIKVKDVDLVNKTIIIPGETAKNNSQESVVIPKGLLPVLKQMELFKYRSEDYVFGRRLLTGPVKYKNPNWISSRHTEITKALRIDSQKGLYSWKHSGVCAYYYATGKDLYALLRQLRHRDLSTTQVYLKSLGLIQNETFANAIVA